MMTLTEVTEKIAYLANFIKEDIGYDPQFGEDDSITVSQDRVYIWLAGFSRYYATDGTDCWLDWVEKH